VLEAACSELPIVGTRVGHVADWADHAAWVVETGDAAALATGIVTMLHDNQLRTQLAQNARAFAEKHDVDWSARELECLYTALVTGNEREQTHR
jgi:glycosyltransferase involved in cell wall biosynthesis